MRKITHNIITIAININALLCSLIHITTFRGELTALPSAEYHIQRKLLYQKILQMSTKKERENFSHSLDIFIFMLYNNIQQDKQTAILSRWRLAVSSKISKSHCIKV